MFAPGCHTAERNDLFAYLECGIGRQYAKTEDELRDILTAVVRYERWSSVQVLGEVGAISKCFDRGHAMSPTNMIKWLKIQR